MYLLDCHTHISIARPASVKFMKHVSELDNFEEIYSTLLSIQYQLGTHPSGTWVSVKGRRSDQVNVDIKYIDGPDNR